MSKTTPAKSDRPAMTAKIGDDAVLAKTGKTWSEWFAALDAANAASLDHKGIVAILSTEHGVPGWWCQMVAVTYEQARGLRVLHQKSGDNYSVSRSKTVGVPLAELFAVWHDARRRRRWLGETITVRKATESKSMRITWPDGSNVEANFYAKGDGKSQVSVEHDKLRDLDEVARLKEFWGEALDRMKAALES
jgi:uncharacterized protein YndB with AHSA1/START domain